MKSSTLFNLGTFLLTQLISQEYWDDLFLNKWIFWRHWCSNCMHYRERFRRKIDGLGTQEYKQVSAICSPLMLKLWPMDHQCSGRCRLLTLLILSPWWKVTKSKHVFSSYHRSNRWSVVLQEVGGRKGPQIISLLRIHPQRKERKKEREKREGREKIKRKREQRKRGEGREERQWEWILKYFLHHSLFVFHLDSLIATIIISTYITESWIDECDGVPNL